MIHMTFQLPCVGYVACYYSNAGTGRTDCFWIVPGTVIED